MAETTIASAAGAAADAARTSGERTLSEAKASMREAADTQRRRAADAVRGMAGALHKAAQDLKTENQTMGRYTDLAAERLDYFAGYLRGTDWDDVLAEAEDLARRRPAWVIGGAMAAGFVLARLVKNAGGGREDVATRTSRRLAAASSVGYGTSTEAGIYPPTTATTHPISSAPGSSAPGSSAPGSSAPGSSGEM